jgi:hypothetical protein
LLGTGPLEGGGQKEDDYMEQGEGKQNSAGNAAGHGTLE